MSFERMQAIADAVLYEGYVLYPYRASSGKNQVRWQFGVLAPPAFCQTHPDEHAWLETQVLVERGTRLRGRVRFLQLQRRLVPGRRPWDEGVERTVEIDEALPVERRLTFGYPGGRDVDGEVLRERRPVRGEIFLATEAVGELLRVRIRVQNLTRWEGPGAERTEALPAALVGVHTMLHLPDGAFVSLLEPPDSAREAAAGCRNVRTYPVLAGEPGRADTVLSSPIILYDHPRIAPESPGDLHDGTEIDEILSLRTLTLTDEEKEEARATDPRAARIIDRVDALGTEGLQPLHGTIRERAPVEWFDPERPDPVSPETDAVTIGGVQVRRGSRVRLAPGRGARRTDAQDLFVAGRVARVQVVLHDVDGGCHLGVTVEDDPAADLLDSEGRYLYFDPDEVVPL
ncbi:MAG TPA: hypothetical protein VFN91_08675 [Myxococcaceae bacterium]|nr:hypothetical protein [Myxococcaceae bacterium]